MTQSERWLLYAYAGIVAIWPIRHLVIGLIFRALRPHSLTGSSPRYAGPSPVPTVTALVPAKDERDALPTCLASVQAQTYPGLIEVLVVDDRSTDGTRAIAHAAARGDDRVRVIEIDDLPPGWTGKTHALHVACAQARGEWLWLIDADTRHEPDSLSIALEYGRANNAALVSLLPEMRCETFWERAVQPLMGIVLMRSFPLTKVNDDRNPLAFANGQYILVRAEAYRAAGGHEAVRTRFVEDIGLAEKVKGLGLPIRTAMGVGIGSTRMYTSLDKIISGWARILYDALGRRPWPLIGKIVEPLVFSQTVFLALIGALVLWLTGHWGPFAAWLLGLGLLHLALQITVLWRFYRFQSPGLGPSSVWYPVAGFVSDWALMKSLWMCRTGRVTWRGTNYGPRAASTSTTERATR